MQLKLRIDLTEPLVLPINYQHIQQGIIYDSLAGEYSASLHEDGFRYRKRSYKAFTFGPFKGKYHLDQKKLTYKDDLEFEIRSADAQMIRLLFENMKEKGIKIGDRKIHPQKIELTEYSVESESIVIRMLSPMTLYSTEADGYTHYYEPWEAGFEELLNDNFKRKYEAYYGVVPSGRISFKIIDCNQRNKKVVRYKNTYVGGWTGIYKLSGKRKYLDFLYQTGIGSRNSQGFGMFYVYD